MAVTGTKQIALYDLILIDGQNVSEMCRHIDSQSEHAQVEAGGFNLTGFTEQLAGATTQSVTGIFYMSGIHSIFYPIHLAKDIVEIEWLKDGRVAISADNPQLRGFVQILTYPRGGDRGELETGSIVFSSADATGLVWYSAAS